MDYKKNKRFVQKMKNLKGGQPPALTIRVMKNGCTIFIHTKHYYWLHNFIKISETVCIKEELTSWQKWHVYIIGMVIVSIHFIKSNKVQNI